MMKLRTTSPTSNSTSCYNMPTSKSRLVRIFLIMALAMAASSFCTSMHASLPTTTSRHGLLLQAPASSWSSIIIVADASAAQGTRIFLYNRPNLQLAPRTATAVQLRPLPWEACYDLPSDFAGKLASGKIQWNVKDGNPDHFICNVVWFFADPKCRSEGGVVGIAIPGGAAKADPKSYAYKDTVVTNFAASYAQARSIACAYTRDPCLVFPCSNPNAVCNSYGGTAYACNCKAGFTKLQNGTCIDKCLLTTCGVNEVCTVSSVNAEPTCQCRPGFLRYKGGCVSNFAHSDWLIPHNEARAAVGSGDMTWSNALAASALSWVNEIAGTSCTNVSRGPNMFRNVGAFGFSDYYRNATDAEIVAGIAGIWSSQKPNYSRALYPGGCATGQKCIHYLRMVWKTSTSVGCAFKSCPGTDYSVGVCDYSEPSLVTGLYPY